MKKTQILVISLVALIVASICSIFLYSHFTSNDSTEANKATENTEDAEYNEISLNIELGNDSYFWATNTDAKTLKDMLMEHEGDEFFEFTEENGEFKVETYKNVVPEQGQEWIFILENCEKENEFCIVEDFEDFELTKNLNFFVIMGEKSKVEL